MPLKPVIACITAQEHCKNIINTAKTMAENLETKLIVLTILPLKEEAVKRAENVKCLKRLSKECNVDITICYSDNPPQSIATFAKQNTPIHIFIGYGNDFLPRFRELFIETPISLVGNDIICTIPAKYDYMKIAK